VERGQHLNYDGWMGSRQGGMQQPSPGKAGMSGHASRMPSARNPSG